jgi:hypothetical protein
MWIEPLSGIDRGLKILIRPSSMRCALSPLIRPQKADNTAKEGRARLQSVLAEVGNSTSGCPRYRDKAAGDIPIIGFLQSYSILGGRAEKRG